MSKVNNIIFYLFFYIFSLACSESTFDEEPNLPGTALLLLDKYWFPIVEVNEHATAYNHLVNRQDAVDIHLKWVIDGQNTSPVDSSKIFLDGTEVWSGKNSTTATIQIKKGGNYKLQILLCNTGGCTLGKPTRIVVTDTDGSHLPSQQYKSMKENKLFKHTSGKVVASIFVESHIYARNNSIEKVPASGLTHLLYDHIAICGNNSALKHDQINYRKLQETCKGRKDFEITIHDIWAAIGKPYNNNSITTEPYKGNFGQMIALKRAQPNLKILPVIGGWYLSDPFVFFDDKDVRSRFVESVKVFLHTWKFFDGITIYWDGEKLNQKFTTKQNFGNVFIHLMQELRESLDQLASETRKTYEITCIINGGWPKLQAIGHNQSQHYIDHIFLRNFDFSGSWSLTSLGHHTPLYAPQWKPNEKFTVDYSVKTLLGQNVNSRKIVVGVVAYGRGWTGVHNFKQGNPFSGTASGPIVKGIFESGAPDYKQITEEILSGKWEAHFDSTAQAPYVFEPTTGELITYDNPRSIIKKGEYVRNNGLGGLFMLDINRDNGELLTAMNVGVGNQIVKSDEVQEFETSSQTDEPYYSIDIRAPIDEDP